MSLSRPASRPPLAAASRGCHARQVSRTPSGQASPPGALGQLRYTLGGRLPGHREWVRHDLTDAGWQLRLLARAFVPIIPVAVVAGLLPLPMTYLHVMIVLLVVLSWGLTVPPLVEPLRNRRLRQHGFEPPPEGQPLRLYR